MFAAIETASFYPTVTYPLGFIVAGLVICFLSKEARFTILKELFWWVGIVWACIGLILVLARFFLWVAKQLGEASGAGGV